MRDRVASVVVAVRNADAVVLHQLDALLPQVRQHELELVVIDDASKDTTRAVIRSWLEHSELKDAILIERRHHGGPNAARNDGVRAATGSFLLFCDGDDIVGDGWAAALLASRSDTELLSGPLEMERLNPSSDLARHLSSMPLPPWKGRKSSGPHGPQRPGFLPYAFGGNMAVLKEHVEAIGGFDEHIRNGGTDVDFAWRLQLQRGLSIRPVPGAVVHCRLPPGDFGAFRRSFLQAFGHAYLNKRHGGVLGSRTLRAYAGAWAGVARSVAARKGSAESTDFWGVVGDLVGRPVASVRHRTRYL